jgi:hypothetical protein
LKYSFVYIDLHFAQNVKPISNFLMYCYLYLYQYDQRLVDYVDYLKTLDLIFYERNNRIFFVFL